MSRNKTENNRATQGRNRLAPLKTARGKNGLMSTGMIALVVAIVVVLNIAVNLLPSKVRQFDLSTTKIYEISDTTPGVPGEAGQGRDHHCGGGG